MLAADPNSILAGGLLAKAETMLEAYEETLAMDSARNVADYTTEENFFYQTSVEVYQTGYVSSVLYSVLLHLAFCIDHSISDTVLGFFVVYYAFVEGQAKNFDRVEQLEVEDDESSESFG